MSVKKDMALIFILRLLAGIQLLKEGNALLIDMEPFLLPIVLVYICLNFALWRPRPEGFYLIITFAAYQFLHNLYWFITSTFLLPIIAYSQEGKLIWALLTLFYAIVAVGVVRRREGLGYSKATSRINSVGVVLISMTILMGSGYLTLDTVGISGHEIVKFTGLNIRNGAISPDGKYLAIRLDTQNYQSNTILWNTRTKKIERTLFSGESMYRMKFSPNGQYLAHFGPGAKVWDVGSGKLVKDIKEDRFKQTGINTGSFGADSNSIAYGTRDGAKLVSLDTNEVRDVVVPNAQANKSNYANSFSVCINPDGTLIALARDQEVSFWDIKTQKLVWAMKSKLDYIPGTSIMEFSRDGQYLALTGLTKWKEKGIELWDVQKQKSMGTFNFGRQINALEFSPNGNKLAIVGIKSSVEVISITKMDTERISGRHSFIAISLLAFSPDGKTLYTGGGDDLKIWNIAN